MGLTLALWELGVEGRSPVVIFGPSTGVMGSLEKVVSEEMKRIYPKEDDFIKTSLTNSQHIRQKSVTEQLCSQTGYKE